jgi:hypothetical protein
LCIPFCIHLYLTLNAALVEEAAAASQSMQDEAANNDEWEEF